MNTGIQGAINIGWKLAAVLDGRAANLEARLDSCNAERFPVGVNLLRGSGGMFTFLSSTNYWFISLRNLILPWILPWVAAGLFVRLRFFRFLSVFGISYRNGPIVGTAAGFKGPIRGGDRLPDGKAIVFSCSRAQLREKGIRPMCFKLRVTSCLAWRGRIWWCASFSGTLVSQMMSKITHIGPRG